MYIQSLGNFNMKIFFIVFTLFFLNLSFADEFKSERGMTNLLGTDTWTRCAAEMSKNNAKVYC